MAELTYKKFNVGLDRRQAKSVADPNRFLQCKNAFVTAGYQIQRRPAARVYAELPAGTKGLAAYRGRLAVFSSGVSIPTGNPNVASFELDEPPGAVGKDIADIHFAEEFEGFLYVAAEYVNGAKRHHYLDGTSPTFITDVNCPRDVLVGKAANKIFAGNGNVVRFSATAQARDWTTSNDAGFLPTGNNHPGIPTCTGLGKFQRHLAVLFPDGLQLWNVDPDPAQNSLANDVDASGTIYARSVIPAFGDLFYLSNIGHRSASLNGFEASDLEDDVGAPIQDIVTPLLTPATKVLGVNHRGGGQYMTFIGGRVFVFAFSRTGKISAWSEYEFSFTVDAVVELGGVLYLRSEDTIYRLDSAYFWDEGDVAFEVVVQPPYLDLKLPGRRKMISGFDAVLEGRASIAHRFDPNDETLETESTLLTEDTRVGDLTPVELCTTAVSPVIRHTRNERFLLSSYTYHFEDMGAAA